MKYTTLPVKPVCELQEKVSQLIQSIREIERIVFRERVEERRATHKMFPTDYHQDARIIVSRHLRHFIKELGEPISCRSYSDGNAYVTWKDDKYEIELIFKNYLFEYIDHEFVNYKPPIEYLKKLK